MKFVHIADMHFDIPFTTLSKKELGIKRRIKQREILKKVIEYIKKENVDYLFIAGDLYENEYIRRSTIEYINGLFKEIPNTKVLITPGNHDPILKSSYYSLFDWNENVYIFNNNISKIRFNNICIYGYGFNDFHMKDNQLSQIMEIDKNNINILITHCDLDGECNSDEGYNPISKKDLEKYGFDYVAIGHIHKRMVDNNLKIVYPGSCISLGFDEQGSHGMMVGEISDNKDLNLEYIELDDEKFIEIDIDVSEFYVAEEIIEEINKINTLENNYVKVNLIGNRNFEINIYGIEKYITNKNIIKIKDKTKTKIDYNSLKNEGSLKGIFVKNILQKIEEEPKNKEKLLRVLEIGLNAM